ncbi:MAG: hypothetical protein AB1412_08235 [Pseudomonadota bacterium]
MLIIPSIRIESEQPPTLQQVRRACRELRLCIFAAYAVIAIVLAHGLIALGLAHMHASAQSPSASGGWALVGDLALIAMTLAAAYALYWSLSAYQRMRLCSDAQVCRVIYAVCRTNPQADRYRLAVLRSGRSFLAAEIDAYFNLSSPGQWSQTWPQDLKQRVQSSEPLFIAAS